MIVKMLERVFNFIARCTSCTDYDDDPGPWTRGAEIYEGHSIGYRVFANHVVFEAYDIAHGDRVLHGTLYFKNEYPVVASQNPNLHTKLATRFIAIFNDLKKENNDRVPS